MFVCVHLRSHCPAALVYAGTSAEIVLREEEEEAAVDLEVADSETEVVGETLEEAATTVARVVIS